MEHSTIKAVGSFLVLAHLLYYFVLPLGAATVIYCPNDCVCVNDSSHVTCDGIGITAIPVDHLPGVVTSLDLSRNHVVVIDSLRGLGNLIELRLRQNNIDTLHRGALDLVAGSLELLDLSKNNMTNLEPGALSVARNLLHVDLSGNQLTDVDGAFDGLHQLSRLDLRQNSLTAITSNTLSGLTDLRYLRLDDNAISSIDSESFVTLDRLMYLVLRGNPLGDVSQFRFSSGLLSYVDMSDCGLERIPAGLPGSVRYMQLRRNRLRTLSSKDLADFAAELSILVLDENQLEHIDDDAFKGAANLQQMWINGNRLRTVPRSLPLSLQRLFVDSNQLESLTPADFPSSSFGVWQLNTLSAMSNNISFVAGDALASLRHLSSLDLAANHIRELYPDTFAGNRRLRMLTLSKNPLQVFGAGCMKGLDALETLSLAYIPTMNMSMAQDAFGDYLPRLRKLDLTSSPGLVDALMASDAQMTPLGAVQDLVLLGSQLRSIDEYFVDIFQHLAVLHLSSTRWHCGASIRWFRNWLLSTSIHLEPARDEIVCASPRHVRGQPLISLTDDDFHAVDMSQHPVRRRGPVQPETVPHISTSSAHGSSTASLRTHDGGPLTWEEVLNRMPDVYDDFVEIDRTNHKSTHPVDYQSYGTTSAGLSLAASSDGRSHLDHRVTLIIVMTIFVTTMAALAILGVIVYTCRKQPLDQPRKTGAAFANGTARNGCKTGHHAVYFVANGGERSPKEDKAKIGNTKLDSRVEMSNGSQCHHVTLLTESDAYQNCPLRVYKWDDF